MPVSDTHTEGTVLVVDDDPMGLRFFAHSLRKSGFEVFVANTVEEAKTLIEEHGGMKFECVLADYRMPAETGLDLLEWLRQQDPALATIIITAEGEKKLVTESLRGGAVDFLDKPITPAALAQAVARGTNLTRRQRSLMTADQGVRAASQIAPLFDSVHAPPSVRERFIHLLRPRHAVGGDFVNVLPVGEKRVAFVLGDVSGHDIRAAFVSAYFQGLARGLLESKASTADVVNFFNTILNKEFAHNINGLVPTSLAVCAGVTDEAEGTVSIVNCGLPPPVLVTLDGRVKPLGSENPPLGWFPERSITGESVCAEGAGFLYVCTDGVHQYAEDSGLNVFSLIHRLLTAARTPSVAPDDQAADDLTVLRYQFPAGQDPHCMEQPIIYEQYHGHEHDVIDRLQNIWRRSLQYALPPVFENRIYDILLCCREAVLNALVHGCERSADKTCTFTVTYCEQPARVTVRVDDPGAGHAFDLDARLKKMAEHRGDKLGLAIMKNLSDAFRVENNGASVVCEFHPRAAKQ